MRGMPTTAIPVKTSWQGLTDDRDLIVGVAGPRPGERCALCGGCADRAVESRTCQSCATVVVCRTPFCFGCAPWHAPIPPLPPYPSGDGEDDRAARAAYMREWRARNPERNTEINVRWRSRNREARVASSTA
jgi:hypothetical protein